MNNSAILDNEIDLRELWVALIKCKMTIFIAITIGTISSIMYAWTMTPLYDGSVLIEVGEVVNNNQPINSNQSTTIIPIDNINNLKEIITKVAGVSATVPAATSNILKLSIESSNPSEIKQKLENATHYIINRHEEKAKLYQNNNSKIRMTQVIGKIQIANDPIKPKKGLIVAIGFISSLFFGIFLAFFIEFITSRRQEN